VRRPGIEVALILIGLPDGTAEVVASTEPDHWGSGRAPEFSLRALRSGGTALQRLHQGDDPDLQQVPFAAHMTCAASAPLRFPDGLEGVLVAGLSGPEPSAGADILWTVDSFARLASISIEDGADRAGGMFGAVRTDQLTGCVSYAALLEDLACEIERSRRDGQPLSCCFVDLDKYKLVNDRFGHPYGNSVLAAVGAALRDVGRTNDTVGRYGGDEFVFVLPGTTEAEARIMAERIRTVTQKVSVDGHPTGLDASVGVAQWISGTGAHDLLGNADRALAKAKTAGGARVVLASSKRFARVRREPAPVPGGEPTKVISLSLASGLAAPAEARAVVNSLSRTLDGTQQRDLRLGISELVTASLDQGGRASDDTIDLQITVASGSIRCEVSGSDRGFVKRSQDLRLVVVDQLATRWGIRHRGRCAWFELDRTA
jgi:diguanylate cyclase (GGDEF)-like protein